MVAVPFPLRLSDVDGRCIAEECHLSGRISADLRREIYSKGHRLTCANRRRKGDSAERKPSALPVAPAVLTCRLITPERMDRHLNHNTLWYAGTGRCCLIFGVNAFRDRLQCCSPLRFRDKTRRLLGGASHKNRINMGAGDDGSIGGYCPG
jgi:hypothetical protein